MGLKCSSVTTSYCSCCFLIPRSHVASNEGHEGNESRGYQEGGPQGHDRHSSMQLRGLQHRFEVEGREGRRGKLHDSCSGAVDEERVLQVRRCIEVEIEEEGCDGSSQGHQPFHQGAVRLQGKACFQDSESPRAQEIQGPCQLIGLENYPSRTKPAWVTVGGLA